MDDRLYPATAVDDTVPVLPSATINPPPQPAAPVQHAASMALNWDGWLDSQPKETQERIRGNLNSSPDKELYKRRLTSTLWMAEREGWHPQDIGKNFDLAMKGFAEKRGQGEVWKDVSTFYSRIQNDAARERDEQVSLEGIKDDTDEGRALREKSLQNRAYYSAVERDDPADDLTMVKEFSRWQQGAIQSGAFNPANAANYYRQWVAIHQQGREDFKVANAAAQKVYGILARTVTERKVGVGGNDVSLKLRSAADDRRVVGDAVGVMENLTPEQKELAFRQIGVFDARSRKEAGIAGEGVAANMAEGAGRSAVNMIENATDSAFLKGIRGRVAKEGDNITRSDYNALLDSMGSKEGKLDTGFSFSSKADPKLTKEQADYLNAYWKKAEGNAEVAYKLRDALQGTIAPLNKTGFFNMGAVTLAESIPLMAAVSVPGLGPALVQQNYAYEAENKLIQKNVPRAKAEVISQFIGAGQAALDMASLGLLKKAPGMQEVFAGLYALPIAAFTRSGVKEGAKIAAAALSNPLAQFAMRATGTTIFETGIEVAQDTLTEAVALQVGHWFDKTIPSTNWRDVWEEMKNTAPETLYSMMLMSSIGAGIATRADIKNIEYLAQDKEAMRLLGISETDMARVQFGSDPFAELQRSVKEAEQSSVRSTAPNVTIDNFSNPEQFYRVVVGDAAFQDIVDTGTVRTRTSDESVKEEGKVTLGGRPTAFPSFSKGTVSLSYAKANPNHYVIVADNDAGLAPSTHGRHGKGKTMFPTSADGQHLASMDAGKVSVYKHTGEGTYQLVWDKGPLTEQSSFATVQNDRTSINSPQTELTPAKARAVLKAVWKDRVVAEDGDSSFQGIGASYEWAQETLKKKAEIAARVAPITPTVDGFDVESPDGSGPVVVETKEEAEVLSVSFFEDQVLNPALNEEEKSVAAAEGRPDISSLDDGISQVGDIRKNTRLQSQPAASVLKPGDRVVNINKTKNDPYSGQKATVKSVDSGYGKFVVEYDDGTISKHLNIGSPFEWEAGKPTGQKQVVQPPVKMSSTDVVSTHGQASPGNTIWFHRTAIDNAVSITKTGLNAGPGLDSTATQENGDLNKRIASFNKPHAGSKAVVIIELPIPPGARDANGILDASERAFELTDGTGVLPARYIKGWYNQLTEEYHANPEFNVDNRISSETGTEEQNNSAQQERMDVLTREDNKMLDEAAGVRRARGDDGWGLRPVTTNPEGNGTIKSGVGFDGLAVANQMRDQLAIENLRAQQQELTDTYEKEKDAARQAQGLEKGSEVSEAVAPTQTGEIVPEPNQTNERQKQEQARQDGQGEVLTPLAEAPSTPAGEQNSPAGVSSEASQQTEAAPAEKPDGENPAPTVSEDEKLWAAKNAQTDAQRKRLGLEPRMEPMKRGWGMVWDLAMQKIADAAKDGRNLAAEILTDFRSSGRALDDLEVAVLTHELIIRETNYENLKASLKDAKTDTAKNEIASRILQLQRDNDELFAAVQETGTITARALAMRQMMIDDRFNIVRMRSELIAANGGRPLTKEQSAEVEAAKEKMDAIKEKQSLKTASILDNQVAELVAGFVEALKQASANIPPEKKKSALKSMAEAARKRNAERLSQVGSGGILFNPLYYIDNTIIIADWLATGAAKTLEGLKKFVQKEFGEDITEEQASKLKADADDIVASVGLTPAEKKTKAAKAKGKVDAEQDMEAAEGNGLPSKSLIYNAVQVKVQLGEKDPLKIMQAVHKDLLKDWPELTELQTKEIFSDYGKTSFPDQNELKRTMRDMRALVQQLAHIERMEKNLPLLKSGPQRDKASQQLREMRRRVGDMKKALGLNKKTDAQISSALDAAKTRLKNEIEDIEKYLKQPGGRTEAQKATKEGLKYDEEATALVKKRDELKGLLETLEGPKVLTFDQIVANTLKALEKTEEVLTRKVETGDVAVKQKQGAPVLTPEIEEKLSYIQTLRESIKESRDALNGNSAEISKEKAKAAAYIRARDEYNKRVAAGNYMPAGKQPTQTAMSKETAAAYDEMQKAKQAYLDLRKTRQADIDLTNDKKNTAKRIEKLKEKIAKGDFTTPSKKQRLEDKELMELKQEEWQVKKDWLTGVFAAKRAEWNNLQKLGNSTANFFGWARAWMTGLDLSALGRQAGFLLLARPIRTLKAFPIMMKASFSDAYAIAHETALYDPKQNPNAQLYRRDKLNITSPFATSLDKLEEEYRSQWLSSPPKWLDVLLKISVVGHLGQKLVRGSARAYTTVLNEIRTQSYDAMAATLTATGVPTEVEGKLIADVINTWTGRGKIPGLKKSEEVLTAMNTIFFAPRYVASRFQTLFMPVALVLREINTRFGNPLKLKDDAELAPIRRMLALEYLRFAAGYAALAGLYTLMQGTGDDDDKIEWDPRSSAFGKFKFGKTFVDPLAGLAQVATLTARLLTQQGKNPQGQVSDKNAWSVLQYFAETKLSPIAGAVRNLAAQQDLRGEETSLLGEMGRLLIPMALRDAVETYQTQQNVFGSAALVFLATCGYAVQNYQDDQKENIADDDYNWLYSQAVGIPKVTLKQQIGTIAGVDTKYDESLKKTLTSDQRKKLMELTLPEVNAAIKDLRQTFKDAPTDKDAWLEFRDEAQKEFNRQVRDIREAHIWEAIK